MRRRDADSPAQIPPLDEHPHAPRAVADTPSSARTQPTAPDTYRTQSSSPDAEPAPFIEPPAVSTAAHPSTLPGGGPSLQHSGDDSIASGGEGVGGEKGGHGGREQRHEFEDRPLSEDERRGLYILGGMLAGGYGLSYATDPRRHRKVLH